MAPILSTTSLLDSLKAIELLKSMILGTNQVRALYGHSYPTSQNTFSVITSVLECGELKPPNERYIAEVIVYTTPASLAEWELVLTGEDAESTVKAMENLYYSVQQELHQVTGGMGYGDVWNEAKFKEA
ncbi:hypothetical protein J4E93_010531 [Alternaria ventricosa]|uniref:uncharacterized protein n=1 Tax=Alternaria ventricosa TaxID=1187951 RepID=UPI0020C37F24|nr:uncharacterized protein J4E93_010531 [Alternaria ventricosa]KAI4638063.1 hypothetical protein J4E93_010531 [Alternaria ventricosa]